MTESWQLSLYLFGLFAASFGVAYAFTKLSHAAKRRGFPELALGTAALVRHRSGKYRCRLSERCADSITFDSPLVADAHIPFRVGDTVKIEVPLKRGVVMFFAEIAGRDDHARRFVVPTPERYDVHDRRAHARTEYEEGVVARVNQQPGILLNASPGGAAVVAHVDVATGEMVRIEDADSAVHLGCVLEVSPETLDGRLASKLRIVFSA